mgnify:CR=1 FL=1
MAHVSLALANASIDGAFAQGAELGLQPLSVIVLDAGGHPIAFRRQDGASSLRFAIAAGKAGGALSLGVSSRKVADMAAERPTFVTSLSALSPYGMIPAAGGTIIVNDEDQPIGAVGVTGDTSNNDEICGLAGIEVARLKSQK